MVSSGSSEVGAAKLAGEVLDIMTRLPSTVEKLTGIDISQVRWSTCAKDRYVMCEAERLAQVVTISRFSHRLRRLQERQPVCVKKRGRAEVIRRGVINIQTRSSTSPPRAYNHCNTVVLSDCVHARVSPGCVFRWFIFHLNRMGLSTLLCVVSFHKTDLSCCAFCGG